MSGRKVTFICNSCGHKWKGIKHHGQAVPNCPRCGSSNVSRK